MNRPSLRAILGAGVAAVALLAGASAAQAACTDGLTVIDAGNTTRTSAAENSAGIVHSCNISEGADSSTGAPTQLQVDHGDGGFWAHLLNLPPGASTAANQATIISDLTTLLARTAALTTNNNGRVEVFDASGNEVGWVTGTFGAPGGGVTSVQGGPGMYPFLSKLLDSGSGDMSNTTYHALNVFQTGPWTISNTSFGISGALPDTSPGDLAAIHTAAAALNSKTPTLGQATGANSTPVVLNSDPDLRPAASTISAPDSGTTSTAGQGGVNLVTGAPTANSFAAQAINGQSSATVTTTGSFTGSLQLEASYDGGTTYAPVSGLLRGTSITTGAITGAGVISLDVAGVTNLRVRATALSAGTPSVKIAFSAASGMVKVLNGQKQVDSGGGDATNTTDHSLRATDTGGDSNNAAFQGEVALTVGTADTQARRSLKAVCTAGGNVSVTYADASTGVWPAVVGAQTWPIAITTVNTSGTTATCTYTNLK